MGFVRFLFREGSPFVFSVLIVLFSLQTIPILSLPDSAIGMFVATAFSLGYMGIQMGLSAFARVGKDGPVVDLFLSLVPLITLIIIAVLDIVGKMPLSLFQMLGLGIAAIVVLMDIIFNTLILFKMNRLANDFVQMQ
ncbi:MAG: hypothetical protein COA85_03920 [Robiginitomaculum sp.]|nr:MAG: hypothetical protein COA85_03920 [Robiginitomaculum sp.]